MSRLNRIAVSVVALTVLAFGAACSSGGSSAESRYNSFVSEYSDTMKDLASAFGEDNAEADTFAEYVASYDCEPLDAAASAIVLGILSPSLQEHGHDPVAFMKDFRALDSAIRAEGYCSGTATTATAPAPTTTTTSAPVIDNSYFVGECNRLIGEYLSTSEDSLNTLSSVVGVPSLYPQARELVAQLIATGESAITACGSYVDVSGIEDFVDSLRDIDF